MRRTLSLFTLIAAIAVNAIGAEPAIDPTRAANTVILDKTGVTNLGIKTVPVMESTFEESVFAIGRIEAIPSRTAVVSSRISGRIVAISAHEGDRVEKGDALATIESRQPGNPPPKIQATAPISGLVTKSHVRLGEPINPDNDLLDIIDLSEVYAIARVPEDLAGEVKVGIKTRIKVAALAGESFEGEMIRIGTSADTGSGTIDAIFKIKNESGRLRPNMRAEFAIITSYRENVMAVPKEAIQGDALNRVVYVKDFDLPNAFVKASVVTGSENDRYIEIKKGLLVGDDVVTTGAYPLAFAGAGSISLKEALDAAHGHEHNEDGSEMTESEKNAQASGAAGEGGGKGGPYEFNQLALFLAIACGVLLLLLVLSLVFRKPLAT